MKTSPHLSVIIPAWNEETRLPTHLRQIVAYLSSEKISWEIVVIDDGSTDRTSDVVAGFAADDPRIRLICLPRNRGKGCAVRKGMRAAQGDLLLFTDADGATPIAELERLRREIDRGADVAVASRALNDPSCSVIGTIHRKVMGSVFNVLVRMLAVRGIRDTQCGFKLFRGEAARAVFPLQRVEGFGFDVEILFLCRKKRFSISEVSVNWTDIPKSKVKLVRDAWRMLRDVIIVRWRDIRGEYDDRKKPG